MYNINKMDYVSKAEDFLSTNVDKSLSNPYIMAVLKLSLVFYGAQIAPRAPQFLQELFKNTYVKLLIVFLIAYISEKDLQLAILIAVIYVLGMNVLSGRQLMESYSDFSTDYKPYKDSKLIEPKTYLYPGCEAITMDDLLKSFGGDREKMLASVQSSFKELLRITKSKDEREYIMKIAHSAGLPFNLTLDRPETAPYIATLLVNYGFTLDDKCHPPSGP